MSKFATLELHPTAFQVTRISDGNYRTEINMIDWDDGGESLIVLETSYPPVVISSLKIRILVEDLIEESSAPTVPRMT